MLLSYIEIIKDHNLKYRMEAKKNKNRGQFWNGSFSFFSFPIGSVKSFSGLKWPDPWHVLIPAERIRFRNVRWLCSSSRLGNDLVSERVDLLTHLPATPERSDFTDVSRTRDYADRLGLAVESSSIATSGILSGPSRRISRFRWKFEYSFQLNHHFPSIVLRFNNRIIFDFVLKWWSSYS